MPTATPKPSPTAVPGALCIGGNQYGIVQHDEFASDKSLNSSSSGPVPISGAFWSTQFAFGGHWNNGGTDDAYYFDNHSSPNPFTIGNGFLGITATPLATPKTAPDGHTRHWASGTLSAPPLKYGYFEVNAKVPDLQGYWPAALWLTPQAGSENHYVNGGVNPEYDVEENFGNALPPGTVQQTDIRQYNPGKSTVARNVVTSLSTAYHTYGLLWTGDGVAFYIDRRPTSGMWPNYTSGPMSAQITLQIFAQNTWAPAPAQKVPETMYLTYYRAYQVTGNTCSANSLAVPK